MIESDLSSGFKKHIASRFDTMVQLNIEPNVADELRDLMAAGGRPIIYGNHQGHGDGWPLVKSVEYIRVLTQETGRDFPGVVLPLAKSMFTGDQGLPLKLLTEALVPVLEERGIKVVPYTRKKDEDKYGLERNHIEVLKMARLVQQEYGFAYLPEASVQGGRHKNPLGFIFGGEIHGIIDVDDKDGFMGFYDLVEKFGRVQGEVFFLPIAMEGSYRFFGADITIPTMELIQGLFVDSNNPMQVTIERPIRTVRLISELQEDWKSDGVALSTFLMSQVAKKLSPQSRGVFRTAA